MWRCGSRGTRTPERRFRSPADLESVSSRQPDYFQGVCSKAPASGGPGGFPTGARLPAGSLRHTRNDRAEAEGLEPPNDVSGRQPSSRRCPRASRTTSLSWFHRRLPAATRSAPLPGPLEEVVRRGGPTKPHPRATTWAFGCLRVAGCRPLYGDAGGAEGTRTPNPLHAMEMRYQLRHSPRFPPPSSALGRNLNLRPGAGWRVERGTAPGRRDLVETRRFELLAFALQTRCATSCATPPRVSTRPRAALQPSRSDGPRQSASCGRAEKARIELARPQGDTPGSSRLPAPSFGWLLLAPPGSDWSPGE